MNRFEVLLQEEEVILADGAMGTMLMDAGLAPGEAPALWNLEHPQQVTQVHEGYLEAGARLLLTNTSGANRFQMAHYDLDSALDHLIKSNGFTIEAVEDDRQVAVFEVSAHIMRIKV